MQSRGHCVKAHTVEEHTQYSLAFSSLSLGSRTSIAPLKVEHYRKKRGLKL